MAVLLLLSAFSIASAQENDPQSPTIVCLPGTTNNSDCDNIGPNQAIQESLSKNMALPTTPFYYDTPDASLKDLPFMYAKVTAESAPIFETMEAAIEGEPVKRYLTTGLDYVSYLGIYYDENNNKYYQIEVNEWMRASELSGGAVYSPFQGLTFTQTPTQNFGWVLHAIHPKTSPSVLAEDAPQAYTRWDVVPFYDVVENEGLVWYQIGLGEWVNLKDFSALYINTNRPEGVPQEVNQWIEIDLHSQTIAAYQDNQLIFASIISSGVDGFWTRPGVFQIYKAIDAELMTGAFLANKADYYYLEDVPWVLYFDEARAIHGAYWHFNLGLAQSHGCVNLAPGDAKFIYDWADIGTYVFVHDPSGKTPTDPSLYGEGGA